MLVFQLLKIILRMIKLCCCCINEPVIFSHCVHLKLGHRFYVMLKVSSDRDDIVPLRSKGYENKKVVRNDLFGFFEYS